MKLPRLVPALALAAALLASSSASAQRMLEALDRGVVAVHQPDGAVFISWRLLGTDPAGVSFNLYRETAPPAGWGGGQSGAAGRGRGNTGPVRLNEEPITTVTWFLDRGADLNRTTSYTVRAVVDGVEQEAGRPFVFKAGAAPLPYQAIPLTLPEGYTPNDASAADLDGDGAYDFVLKSEVNPQDNSRPGVTGETLLQGYSLENGLLWTINLGPNIREGAHYTQFMVYDLDGDGRAEIAVKTADGTVDGKGKVIGNASARHANANGHILKRPEFFTIFDGLTGAELATTDYVPGRYPTKTDPSPEELRATWGDPNGNRSDRYLAGVAYLDGERPSVIMCRGYYTRAVLAAWDYRDGKLTQRWVFDSDAGPEENRAYRGQGFHSLSVADVDGDGRDEIVYGAAVIDDNGKGLYSTGWGHGDALHVSDFDPSNPGLEVFGIQERFDKEGMNFRDARTGRPIFLVPSVKAATEGGDRGEGPGRGNAVNIDPRFPGAEFWANGAEMSGTYNAKGERFTDRKPGACNFAIWWDGDLLRELLDQNRVTKWNWETETLDLIFRAQGAMSNNGTKATPALSADLFGDWREEIVLRSLDNKELRIYTTTIPTKHRLTTLMHDSQYRLAIAWQNVAYNQPPHPSFYLDDDAPLPTHLAVRVTPKK